MHGYKSIGVQFLSFMHYKSVVVVVVVAVAAAAAPTQLRKY